MATERSTKSAKSTAKKAPEPPTSHVPSPPPPQNLRSERVVLSSLLRMEDMAPRERAEAERVLSRLHQSAFIDERNNKTAQCMCSLRDSNKEITMESLWAMLVDLEWAGIVPESHLELIGQEPPSIHLAKHFAIVVRAYRARQAIKRAQEFAAGAYYILDNEFCNNAESSDADIFARLTTEENPLFESTMNGFLSDIQEIVSDAGMTRGKSAHQLGIDFLANFDQQQVALQENRPLEGTRTGMASLDKVLGVLRPGLTIVAAWSGVGKSSLARRWAMNIATQKTKRRGVVIFGTEMTNHETYEAMVYAVAEVDGNKPASGIRYTQEETDRIAEATAYVSSLPIHFEDAGTLGDKTPAVMETILRRKAREWQADDIEPAAVFVDYLQLFEPDVITRNREQDMSKLAYGLHNMGQRLRLPVVALSQLNENGKKSGDGRPCAEDLRESRGITQAAVTVVLIHNPEYMARRRVVAGTASNKEELVEIIVDKGRRSPVGIIQVIFRPWCASFVDLSEKKPDAEETARANMDAVDDPPLPPGHDGFGGGEEPDF